VIEPLHAQYRFRVSRAIPFLQCESDAKERTMKMRRSTIAAIVAIGALTGMWGYQTLQAQQPAAFKRTPVQKHDLSAQGREGVQVLAEFAPGAAAGKHTHPEKRWATCWKVRWCWSWRAASGDAQSGRGILRSGRRRS
jgi:hypothetical protein